MVDRDEPGSRLDQSSGQEHPLTVDVQSVTLAEGERFLAGWRLFEWPRWSGSPPLVVDGLSDFQRPGLDVSQSAEVVDLPLRSPSRWSKRSRDSSRPLT